MRLHGLDGARALLLLFGIPYHYALLAGSTFDRSEAFNGSIVIGTFMSGSHTFRMAAFFLLSGFFSAMIIQKRGREYWFPDRVKRLGLPLVASLATLGILQYQLLAAISDQPPGGLFGLPIDMGQFWFLGVLLVYVCLLYLIPLERLAALPVCTRAFLLKGLPGLALLGALVFWSLGQAAFGVVLRSLDVGEPVATLSRLVLHLPMFALGALLRFSSIGERAFERISGWYLGLALVLLPIYIALDSFARPALGLPVEKGLVGKIAANMLEVPLAFFMSMVILFLFTRMFKSPNAVISFFVRAALAIYLFHLMWVYVVVSVLAPLGMPVLLEWIVGSAIVLLLSTASYMIARRIPGVSMAFCGLPALKPFPSREPSKSLES